MVKIGQNWFQMKVSVQKLVKNGRNWSKLVENWSNRVQNDAKNW